MEALWQYVTGWLRSPPVLFLLVGVVISLLAFALSTPPPWSKHWRRERARLTELAIRKADGCYMREKHDEMRTKGVRYCDACMAELQLLP